jgi:hypothetical protein
MRADHIVGCVLEGIIEGIVDVALSGEMDNRTYAVFMKQMQDKIFAADISLDEFVSGLNLWYRHVCWASTVVQTIKIYDADVGIGSKNVIDEIRADESAAAGY